MVLTILAATAALAVSQDITGIPAGFRGVWVHERHQQVAVLMPTAELSLPCESELRRESGWEFAPLGQKGSSWVHYTGERLCVASPVAQTPSGTYFGFWVGMRDVRGLDERRPWYNPKNKSKTSYFPKLIPADRGDISIGLGNADPAGNVTYLLVDQQDARKDPLAGQLKGWNKWAWAGGPELVSVSGAYDTGRQGKETAVLNLSESADGWQASVTGTLVEGGRTWPVKGFRSGLVEQIDVLDPRTGANAGRIQAVWAPTSSDAAKIAVGERVPVSELRAFLYLANGTWPSGLDCLMRRKG